MAKFLVKITKTITTTEDIEIETDSRDPWRVRETVAQLHPVPNGAKLRIDVLKQLDGPWAEPGYGGELWYIHKSPIMTFRAPHGRYLLEEDIAVLTQRITAEGLSVVKHWHNSEGGVSIECAERKFDPMPPEMTARILAPR